MADEKFITQEQFVETMAKIDKRLDRLELNLPKDREITIPASGWVSSGDADYPYQYTLAVEGVTAASKAELTLDDAGVSVGTDCGFCPGVDTGAGTVIFKSYEIPTAAMSGVLTIRKEAATSST